LIEYHLHIQPEYLDKSAMVEHSVNVGYHIHLHNTSILSTTPRCMDHIIRKVTEIELHPNNAIREDCFFLNHANLPSVP
jgi:hypothetical protein